MPTDTRPAQSERTPDDDTARRTDVGAPRPSTPRGRRPNPWVRIPAVLAALVVVAVVAFWGVDNLVHTGKVLPGVRVGTTAVGGLGTQDATAALASAAKELDETPQPYTVGGTAATVVPADIGYAADTDAALADALAVGRTGNPFGRFFDWARLRLGGVTVGWPSQVSESRMTSFVDSQTFPERKAPVEPVVTFAGLQPELTAGVDGRGVDTAGAVDALRDAFGTLPRRDVALPLRTLPPRWSDAQARGAADDATRTLLAAPVSVTLGGASTTLAPDQLASVLRSAPDDTSYAFTTDKDAALALLRPRFTGVGEPPVDAAFTVVNGKVQITPARSGVGCCGDDTAGLLDRAMAASDPAARLVTLPEGRVPPAVTEADLKAMNVTTLLGTFTTEHPDGQPRVRNIHKIADMVRGTVVKPGETYSINKTIGERKASDGWVNAPSLYEGKKTDTPGGGISQFATTLYNALYYAGIQIDEHTPHTTWFSRYPKGREATLGYPKPDLVFTNDTPAPVLIWPSYNDTSITVQIFGTNDGRQAGPKGPVEIRKEGACEIVRDVRVIRWPDGRVEEQPYTQRYKPEGKGC